MRSIRATCDSNSGTGHARRLRLLIGACLVFDATLATAARGADDPKSTRPGQPSSAPAKRSGAEFLEDVWPGHPEWMAMLADILVKGERISGDDGWFRKGTRQTRFDWKSVRSAHDKNGDDAITRSELSVSDADFARLDRDRDGVLTAADFDFNPAPSSAPPLANMLFVRADRDSNGKLTRAEFDAFFKGMDPDGPGFLSLDDLEQAFAPARRNVKAAAPAGPTRWTFLHSFVRGELGAFPTGPDLDERAPDFTLKPIDGGHAVTLSKQIGPKPVVLIFGNFSCTPFRAAAGNLEKLYRRYKDRATFLMVYVREAHPTDGWRMPNNDQAGIAIRQPRSDSERLGVAQTCGKSLGLSFPMLVDTIDDSVNNRYSGIPSRFYIIDRAGKIAYKSGRGPFGFKPAEMEQSLVLLLNHESRKPRSH